LGHPRALPWARAGTLICSNVKLNLKADITTLGNYDTTIVNNTNLNLKSNIIDVNNTVASIVTTFNNYDTSIASNTKLALNADLTTTYTKVEVDTAVANI
jgi:hypothetical protein